MMVDIGDVRGVFVHIDKQRDDRREAVVIRFPREDFVVTVRSVRDDFEVKYGAGIPDTVPGIFFKDLGGGAEGPDRMVSRYLFNRGPAPGSNGARIPNWRFEI